MLVNLNRDYGHFLFPYKVHIFLQHNLMAVRTSELIEQRPLSGSWINHVTTNSCMGGNGVGNIFIGFDANQ